MRIHSTIFGNHNIGNPTIRSRGSGYRLGWNSYHGPAAQNPANVTSDANRGGPAPAREPTTKQIQDHLRSLGYKLASDNQMGPITRSAMAAVKNHIPAKVWNLHITHPTNANNQRQQSNEPAGPARTVPAIRSGKTGAEVLGSASHGGTMFPGIDPNMYTKALMDAEYGPVLAELMRQERVTRSSGDNRVAEIQDMYGAQQNRMQGYEKDNQAARDVAIQRIGGLAGGLGAGIAMDPNVQGDVNARGNIAESTARLLDMTDRNTGTASIRNMGLGGIFAANQAREDTRTKLGDIFTKRSAAIAERGAKAVTTKQDMLKWMTETGMAAQKLGLDTQSTMASLASAAAGIRNKDASTNYFNKRAANVGKAKAGSTFPKLFKNMSAPQKKQVGDAVRNAVGDPTGKNTEQIVRMINSTLRSYGYKPKMNRNWGNFAKNLYESITSQKADPGWWGL